MKKVEIGLGLLIILAICAGIATGWVWEVIDTIRFNRAEKDIQAIAEETQEDLKALVSVVCETDSFMVLNHRVDTLPFVIIDGQKRDYYAYLDSIQTIVRAHGGDVLYVGDKHYEIFNCIDTTWEYTNQWAWDRIKRVRIR